MKSAFEKNTCRLCLKVGVKVFKLGKTPHKGFIESILKLQGYNYALSEDHCACYICMNLLSKTSNFINMVCHAQKILYDLLKSSDLLTIPMLRNIDRHKNGLNLMSLSSATFIVFATKEISLDTYHKKRNLITKTVDVKSKNKGNNLEIRQSKQARQNKENGHVNRTVNYSLKEECIEINDSSDENVIEPVELEIDVPDAISESKDPISVDKKISAQLLSTYIDIEVPSGPESVLMKNDIKDDASENNLSKMKSLNSNKEAYSKPHNKCEEDNYPIAVDKQILEQPSSTCIDTEASDGPELVLIKNYTKADELESIHSETKSSSSVEQVYRRRRKKREEDEDYQPDSTSHSEDSDFDSYDDKGIKIKRPKPDYREYPRNCDHCNYTVPRPVDHYRHYQYMHPDIEYPFAEKSKYPCSVCGKEYTKRRINPHELSHSINMKIKCSLCPRICETRRILHAHRRTSHPKTTYTCDYCSKVFKTRTDIMRHIRIHTGEKPFKCHICGAGFAHSGNRKIHIRSSHQNYNYTPKKQKKNQQVRRHKKYNYTDTEIESSDDENKTQKKVKYLKKKHKFKKGNEHTNAEMKSEDEKRTPKTRKAAQKLRNSTESNDTNSEHIKRTPKRLKEFRDDDVHD